MAPKPAVVEEQPINAIPYYPAQQQQFQANYNANNIGQNGEIITDPIKSLKIQLSKVSSLTCCCFFLFLFFATIFCGLYFDNSNLVVPTNVYCYYTNGKTNSITYETYVYADYNNGSGYYAQSTISGGLSSTDVIACILTTTYDYVISGYFIFYFAYETNDLCLDVDTEPTIYTRCSNSEALQYTEPCEEINYDPTDCTNKYVIMNYQTYQSTEIFITTAQGISESNVEFTLDYTLVFGIKDAGRAPFFYGSLILMVLALILFCGACWRCLLLWKKYKNVLTLNGNFENNF